MPAGYGPAENCIPLAEYNQADLTIIRALNFPRDTSLLDDSAYGRLKNAIIDDRQNQLKEITASGPVDPG